MSKKTPLIRFKEFDENWKQYKLNSLVERITRKNTNLESTLPLTISAQNGLVDQNNYFNKQVASRDVSNYYLIKKGEFAYNKSYSKGYPLGAVKRLDLYDKGVLSTLYIAFKPTNVDSDFLVSYYGTNRWHKEVSMRASEGARNHGLLNISPTDFLDTELRIPLTNSEQEKIGDFSKHITENIRLHQDALDLLKQSKKAFLQKMFPEKGENFPEIRFSGFSAEWKLSKLGDLANFSKGKGYKKGDLRAEGIPIILYGRLYTHYKTVIDNVDTYVKKTENSITSNGNEVIVPASGETSEDISRASVVIKPGIIIGGDLNIIIPSSEIDSTFLALTISNGDQKKELSRRAQGKSVVHIRNSNLKNVNLVYPNIKEQTKIGDFFNEMDASITNHEQKLVSLKQMKKAFLQKMFV